MPYIPQPERAEILNNQRAPKTAGELNFLFTEIIQTYLTQKGLCYQHINDIIGALEGCKLELYRRVASSYEDAKIKANGDAYIPEFVSKSE